MGLISDILCALLDSTGSQYKRMSKDRRLSDSDRERITDTMSQLDSYKETIQNFGKKPDSYGTDDYDDE